MILFIIIKSKNKNSLKTFTTLIQNILTLEKLLINDYFVHQLHKKKKLKYYSVLKSPHVFKKAQRQLGFENTTILWELRVNMRFINQIITMIKRILQINLKDLNISLKFRLNAIESKNRVIKTFDTDNYHLDIFSPKNKYLYLLDIYGSSLFHSYKF